MVNPSPYMIYLQARGSILVASSPEILCRVGEDRTVTNRRGCPQPFCCQALWYVRKRRCADLQPACAGVCCRLLGEQEDPGASTLLVYIFDVVP